MSNWEKVNYGFNYFVKKKRFHAYYILLHRIHMFAWCHHLHFAYRIFMFNVINMLFSIKQDGMP